MPCRVCEGSGYKSDHPSGPSDVQTGNVRTSGVRAGDVATGGSADGRGVSGLACPACAGTGLSGISVRETRLSAPPSIEDDVYAETQVLIYTLLGSHLFPGERVAGWIADLNTLRTDAPAESQSVIEAIGQDYRQAKQDAARLTDSRAPGVDGALVFDRETSEIERHLAFLGALMTHAKHRSGPPVEGR